MKSMGHFAQSIARGALGRLWPLVVVALLARRGTCRRGQKNGWLGKAIAESAGVFHRIEFSPLNSARRHHRQQPLQQPTERRVHFAARTSAQRGVGGRTESARCAARRVRGSSGWCGRCRPTANTSPPRPFMVMATQNPVEGVRLPARKPARPLPAADSAGLSRNAQCRVAGGSHRDSGSTGWPLALIAFRLPR